MSAPVEPYYAPLAEMAYMQKLQSHDRDSLSKAGLRKRHWRSWTNGERLLLAVSVCMALLLVSLSGFILSRTDNKLVITTDPKLLSQAKFLQGAWLTFQSFCVMALMLPVWNCVTTIKSEEWIRMAGRSPSVLVKHVNAASATPTSAFNSLAYGQSRHASPLFRCALLVSALAFAASSTSHGLLFLNVVKVGQPGNIDIAVLGDGAVYKYAELVGSARRADGPFNEESAIRLASLMYLSRSGAKQGGSLATGLSASGKLYDVNNVSVPQFILPTPVNTPDGSTYETDVIIFNTSCSFYSPNEVSSASGKPGGWTTVRYAWNEPTTAVQIRLDDGTDMIVGASLSLPQTIAPIYFLASPDTLTDYSSRGYTGWLILANSHFNSIRLDGLPATGNLSSFGKEANHTMATVLLCQPNLKIEVARVQYGLRESVVHLSGGPLTGNIDVTQAGLLFSSMLAALHRAPGNSSFVGSDDIFSTSIVLDQVRRYTRDGGWFYPNPLPVIEQNLSPYWSTIGKAYLAGVTAQSVMAVPAIVPVDGLALSTAKTNFYISLFLFLTLLGFLLVVSSRRVLPSLELIPVLEAFCEFGQVVSRKEISSMQHDQTMKQRRVIWKEIEGRFEDASRKGECRIDSTEYIE